jgi:hypothetical protein
MSDPSIPAKYETTYYEVIQREMAGVSTLVDLAIGEEWPLVELERIQKELELLHHHVTDTLNDRRP